FISVLGLAGLLARIFPSPRLRGRGVQIDCAGSRGTASDECFARYALLRAWFGCPIPLLSKEGSLRRRRRRGWSVHRPAKRLLIDARVAHLINRYFRL